MSSLSSLVSVGDFKQEAEKIMPRKVRNFVNSGAVLEQTLHENEEALKRWYIRPRFLVDVSKCDLSTTVLGYKVQIPFGVSPVGMQKLVHTEGEMGTAKAAEKMGTIFTLSTAASTNIEEIPTENALRFFQLYIQKDRKFTESLVKRAEKAGYAAIVVTLDALVLGIRYAVFRDKFTIPSHIRTPQHDTGSSGEHAELKDSVATTFDRSVTWEYIAWLKSITSLPIVLKGILTAEDALKAAETGVVSAIWVSNHGGRQLDGTLPTVDALTEVIAAVKGRCEVYVDGGFRSGSDIFKAIALGAKMVFLGRPVVWALACGGSEGVVRLMELLKHELETTMILSGYPSIDVITNNKDVLMKRNESKL